MNPNQTMSNFPIKRAENVNPSPLQFRYQPAQQMNPGHQVRSYSTSHAVPSRNPLEGRQYINNPQLNTPINVQSFEPSQQPRTSNPPDPRANVYQSFQQTNPIQQNRQPISSSQFPDNKPINPNTLFSQTISGNFNNRSPNQNPVSNSQNNGYFSGVLSQTANNIQAPPPHQNYNPLQNPLNTTSIQTNNVNTQSQSFGLNQNVNNPLPSNPLNQSFQNNQSGTPRLQSTTQVHPETSQNRNANPLMIRQGSQNRSITNAQGETRSQLNAQPHRPEQNDNMSYHSKISTHSRNHPILRALSVNNDEHYHSLVSKEEALKDNNILLVQNYWQNVDGTKRNVMRNMSDNYKAKVSEIWNSYFSDQVRANNSVGDVSSLTRDVEMIKNVFYDFLMAKTELFVEELKNRKTNEVFAEAEATQDQRRYIDDAVQNIVDNQYTIAQNKNKELKEKLNEAKLNYQQTMDSTVAKYKKVREEHITMYDREFTFKLNGDQSLVRNTLSHSLPFLQSELQKSEAKLSQLRQVTSPNNADSLRYAIESLENEKRLYAKR